MSTTIEAATKQAATTPAYEALEAATSHLIEHYRDDLLKHDRRFCADNPSWEFLHFAGPCGTHLVDMRPSGDYPKSGEIVPFLFGHADRYHLLNSGLDCIRAIESSSDRRTVHYWDGSQLWPIDFKRARNLYLDYMESVRGDWKAGR